MRSSMVVRISRNDYKRRLLAPLIQHLGRVEIEPCCPQLFGKLPLPALRGIHLRVNHTIEVGRDVDLSFAEHAGAAATELAGKISEFKNNVLTRLRARCRCTCRSGKVVRREEDNGKADFRRAILELLDDGAALVWLFAKYDCFEAKPFDKPGGRLECGFVVTVDDEILRTLGIASPPVTPDFSGNIFWISERKKRTS
jgi:hypothetical protein